jgi:hypothetical protein
MAADQHLWRNIMGKYGIIFETELHRFRVQIEVLLYEQFYNCDETGVNFETLSSKTLVSRKERRQTILACCTS